MRKMSEMPYHIGLQVKIYPSDLQKHLIAVNDGAKRAVYNHLVAYTGTNATGWAKLQGMVLSTGNGSITWILSPIR